MGPSGCRLTEDLLFLVQTLMDKGVRINFLKESISFDPQQKASPMSKLILGVMGAVAEFERALIRERQREGIALARARGAYKGRARKGTSALLAQARGLLAQGGSVQGVAKQLGVSRASLYRWFNEAGMPIKKSYSR